MGINTQYKFEKNFKKFKFIIDNLEMIIYQMYEV